MQCNRASSSRMHRTCSRQAGGDVPPAARLSCRPARHPRPCSCLSLDLCVHLSDEAMTIRHRGRSASQQRARGTTRPPGAARALHALRSSAAGAAAMAAARPLADQRLPWMPRYSTMKSSWAPGGMTPPAPRSPAQAAAGGRGAAVGWGSAGQSGRPHPAQHSTAQQLAHYAQGSPTGATHRNRAQAG